MLRNTKVYIDGIINERLKNNNGCMDFSGIHLSESDMLRIRDRLKDNQNIHTLILRQCSLDGTSARPLVSLVESNKNIIKVDYSSNPVGFEIELDLTVALERNKKLIPSNDKKEVNTKIELGLFKTVKETLVNVQPTNKIKMKRD